MKVFDFRSGFMIAHSLPHYARYIVRQTFALTSPTNHYNWIIKKVFESFFIAIQVKIKLLNGMPANPFPYILPEFVPDLRLLRNLYIRRVKAEDESGKQGRRRPTRIEELEEEKIEIQSEWEMAARLVDLRIHQAMRAAGAQAIRDGSLQGFIIRQRSMRGSTGVSGNSLALQCLAKCKEIMVEHMTIRMDIETKGQVDGLTKENESHETIPNWEGGFLDWRVYGAEIMRINGATNERRKRRRRETSEGCGNCGKNGCRRQTRKKSVIMDREEGEVSETEWEDCDEDEGYAISDTLELDYGSNAGGGSTSANNIF